MLVFAGRVKAEPTPAVECRAVECRNAGGGVLLRGLRDQSHRASSGRTAARRRWTST